GRPTCFERVAYTRQCQNRVDAQVRIRRADDDGAQPPVRESRHERRLWPRGRGAVVSQLFDRGDAAPTYEIVLKVEPALVGSHARAHTVIAHGKDTRADAQTAAQILSDARERLARREPPRALNVGCKIAVAELEPSLR